MNKSILYTLFFLFCLVAGWILVSEPDGLVVKMKINKNNEVFRNIYYLKKEKFKVVTNPFSIIFSGDKVNVIDTKQKRYWSGNREIFNQFMLQHILDSDLKNIAKNNHFKKSLKKQNKILQQEVISEVSGREYPKAEIRETPNFTSISGYASRKYQIIENDSVVEEIWIAENLKNYINYDLNLDLYTNYMESLLEHTESKLYFHYETFMKIIENGFPMKINMYKGKSVTETEVERLIKMKLDDDMFEVPGQFKKVELNQLIQ